jgi:hypothetical protein
VHRGPTGMAAVGMPVANVRYWAKSDVADDAAMPQLDLKGH